MSEIIIGNFSDRDRGKEEVGFYNTPHISPDSAAQLLTRNHTLKRFYEALL